MRARLVIGASAGLAITATLGVTGFIDPTWGLALGLALVIVHTTLLALYVIREVQSAKAKAVQHHRSTERLVKRSAADSHLRSDDRLNHLFDVIRAMDRSVAESTQASRSQRVVVTEMFKQLHGLPGPAPDSAKKGGSR